jgi:hypothetical protein
MCTPKHIAEAMASKGEGDMDATAIAMCDLEDRASETGFSEQALRQLMKEAFLLEMERKRQMGEAMLPERWCRSPSIGKTADGAPNRDCCSLAHRLGSPLVHYSRRPFGRRDPRSTGFLRALGRHRFDLGRPTLTETAGDPPLSSAGLWPFFEVADARNAQEYQTS